MNPLKKTLVSRIIMAYCTASVSVRATSETRKPSPREATSSTARMAA